MIIPLPLSWLDSIGGVWEGLTQWVNTLLMAVIAILPDSPFQKITTPAAVSNVLGYINYILPVSAIVTTTVIWMSAVLGYYVIKVILNWLKAVNS